MRLKPSTLFWWALQLLFFGATWWAWQVAAGADLQPYAQIFRWAMVLICLGLLAMNLFGRGPR